MYYLVIKNLGVEQCIASAETDTFKTNQSCDCSLNLYFSKNVLVRKIKVICDTVNDKYLIAKVFKD